MRIESVEVIFFKNLTKKNVQFLSQCQRNLPVDIEETRIISVQWHSGPTAKKQEEQSNAAMPHCYENESAFHMIDMMPYAHTHWEINQTVLALFQFLCIGDKLKQDNKLTKFIHSKPKYYAQQICGIRSEESEKKKAHDVEIVLLNFIVRFSILIWWTISAGNISMLSATILSACI